jgi:RNA polymerase sigma factor (sigma-70 family)
VTYGLGTASSSGQSNGAMVRKPLPVFRTKEHAGSSALKVAGRGTGNVAEEGEEELRKNVLEEMFVASRPKFLAIAYSILRNRDDAEDAVQEAFLSAYRHLRAFEGRSALKTWLTRIVLNAALMMQRKRKPVAIRSFFEDGAEQDDDWTENIPDLQPNPEMIHAERETLQFIDEKVGKLKPVLRQAFKMTYYDDLSGAEASAKIGISCGTFKARLFHARRKLSNRMKRDVVTPIRRTPGASPESWKGKGLRRLQGLES